MTLNWFQKLALATAGVVVAALVYGAVTVYSQDTSGANNRITPRTFVTQGTNSPGAAQQGSLWISIVGTTTVANASYFPTNPLTGVYPTSTLYAFARTGIVFYVQAGTLGSNSFSSTNLSLWVPIATNIGAAIR